MSRGPRRAKGITGEPTDAVDNAGDNGGGNGADSSGDSIAAASGPAAIDPTTAEQPADLGDNPPAPRRGRGRPPGSGTASKTKPLPLNVTGLEKLLVGIHGGLALLSSRHEWSLDTDAKIFDGKTEAEFLAQSTADVARHYGGIADQKTLDWMNLIQCLAIVYGGRIYAIRANPRVKPPAKPNLAVRPGHEPLHHVTQPATFSPDSVDPANMGAGEIAGIGAVEFPDGHPLKPKLN